MPQPSDANSEVKWCLVAVKLMKEAKETEFTE
jgi:hypothetical protein